MLSLTRLSGFVMALAGLSASFAVLLIGPPSATAGIDRSMCRHTDERITIPENFPLEVCFDGKKLHLANDDLDAPVVIRTGGSARVTTTRTVRESPLSPGAIASKVPPREDSDLFPTMGAVVAIGDGEATVWPSVMVYMGLKTSSYAFFKSVYDILPIDAIGVDQALVSFVVEMDGVTQKRERCVKTAGNVLSRAKCSLVHFRDKQFATGRLIVEVGLTTSKKLEAELLGVYSAMFDTAKLLGGQLESNERILASGKIIIAPVVPPQRSRPPATTASPRPEKEAPEAPREQPQPDQSQTPMAFAIHGVCTTATGALTSTSSGFTPGARFTISAAYPNGSAYTALGLGAGGTVRADGSVAWQWGCTGDPAGAYTTTVIDVATGRSTGPVAFTIAPAPVVAPDPEPESAPKTVEPATTVASPSQETPPVVAPRVTVPEQQATHGADTFLDPYRASGKGTKIPANAWVEVSCKVHAPSIQSATPAGFWYLIASAPWNDQYYAVANTFWNGDSPGQYPYTHHVDYAVPDC